MVVHEVRVHPSAARLPREAQLTWKIAELAAAAPLPEADVARMVSCRLADNAGVALAALNRQPVATARVMALAHPRPNGATLFGLPPTVRVQAEWACWANATAVRELDFHDCVSPGAHPGDNIAPLIAVAQQLGCDGAALVRAIAVAYEVQVALLKGIPLPPSQKEQTGHLCPATTAGLGALLGLEVLEAFLSLAYGLPEATPEALAWLNPAFPPGRLQASTPDGRGIFDHGLAGREPSTRHERVDPAG